MPDYKCYDIIKYDIFMQTELNAWWIIYRFWTIVNKSHKKGETPKLLYPVLHIFIRIYAELDCLSVSLG